MGNLSDYFLEFYAYSILGPNMRIDTVDATILWILHFLGLPLWLYALHFSKQILIFSGTQMKSSYFSIC